MYIFTQKLVIQIRNSISHQKNVIKKILIQEMMSNRHKSINFDQFFQAYNKKECQINILLKYQTN